MTILGRSVHTYAFVACFYVSMAWQLDASKALRFLDAPKPNGIATQMALNGSSDEARNTAGDMADYLSGPAMAHASRIEEIARLHAALAQVRIRVEATLASCNSTIEPSRRAFLASVA